MFEPSWMPGPSTNSSARRAPTRRGLDRPVTDDQLRRIYDLMKWGPTSANSSPARILFLRSRAAKERLAPARAPHNVQKTPPAPRTANVAHDHRLPDELPRPLPPVEARSWFRGNEQR